MNVKLDSRTIKALASKSRIDILKALRERKHMQTELADYLSLSVPTIKEHLGALQEAELVERFDEGRKWKYYGLTKKGKAVLEPEETRIFLMLALTILSMIGWIATMLQTKIPAESVVQKMMEADRAALTMMANEQMIGAEQNALSAAFQWNVFFLSTTIICATLLVIFLIRSILYKKALNSKVNK